MDILIPGVLGILGYSKPKRTRNTKDTLNPRELGILRIF